MEKIVATILIYFISLIAYSQTSDTKLIEKLTEKGILTKEEANEIIREAKSEQKANIDLEALTDIFESRYLKLGGYSQLLYSYSNTQANKHNMSVRNVYLSIKGEPIDNLKYSIIANFRNPSLTEYYIDWILLEEIQLRIGQHKVPLSIENQLSQSVLEFIQNARATSYLGGGTDDVLTIQNGTSSGGRDIGVKAFGSLLNYQGRSLVEYGIGLYQGSGINASAPRSNKDFVTNVLVSPIEGWRIGGGLQFGEARYQNDFEYVPSIHVRNRWLISSDFRQDNFYARAEWINGNDGSIKKEGLYGMATWTFAPQWTLLGRASYYNHYKKIGLKATDLSTGVTYALNDVCRLQANYTYSEFNREWKDYLGGKNSHTIEAQFQIIY